MKARAAVVLAALVAGCGGSADEGRLEWAGKAYSGTPSKLLPRDHVVLGTVRNGGDGRLQVHFRDVRVLDADGDPVVAGVRFTHASGHGLYPPTREPSTGRAKEDLRIGRAIDLAPGDTAPIVVSWRGGADPVAVDYGPGSLDLP